MAVASPAMSIMAGVGIGVLIGISLVVALIAVAWTIVRLWLRRALR